VGDNVQSNNQIIPIEKRGTGERRNANIVDATKAVVNSRFDTSFDQSRKKFFLFARIKIVLLTYQTTTSRSRLIIALEDEHRMMIRHQRAAVRECRMNGQKDQETGNACGSNQTSVKAWGSSAIKESI
jgi:hypothetical protein